MMRWGSLEILQPTREPEIQVQPELGLQQLAVSANGTNGPGPIARRDERLRQLSRRMGIERVEIEDMSSPSGCAFPLVSGLQPCGALRQTLAEALLKALPLRLGPRIELWGVAEEEAVEKRTVMVA